MLQIEHLWNKAVLKKKQVYFGLNLIITGRIYIHGKKSGINIGDNETFHSVPTV